MTSQLYVLDIETIGIPEASQFIEAPECPGYYKKPESIAQWQAEEAPKILAERVARAALDIDLAEIVALGLVPLETVLETSPSDLQALILTREQDDEAALLRTVDEAVHAGAIFVTYNGRTYDLALILRRFMYHGVAAPRISLDRYRSEHIDLYEQKITYFGAVNGHKLSWYAKRFGWTDVSSRIEGGGVGSAARDGDWDGIREHCACDLIWTARLAHRLGLS